MSIAPIFPERAEIEPDFTNPKKTLDRVVEIHLDASKDVLPQRLRSQMRMNLLCTKSSLLFDLQRLRGNCLTGDYKIKVTSAMRKIDKVARSAMDQHQQFLAQQALEEKRLQRSIERVKESFGEP